ncbi:MAG: hypothetical protein E5X43_01445 [Mesorhizobium sp.]|nr:MAG: hypothetical protein E5X43_01445 [Mesorhizobium sp.]
MTPKIGIDFRRGSCAKSKRYSVLCASLDVRRCSPRRSRSHFRQQGFGPLAPSRQGGETVGETLELNRDANAFLRRLEDDEGG